MASLKSARLPAWQIDSYSARSSADYDVNTRSMSELSKHVLSERDEDEYGEEEETDEAQSERRSGSIVSCVSDRTDATVRFAINVDDSHRSDAHKGSAVGFAAAEGGSERSDADGRGSFELQRPASPLTRRASLRKQSTASLARISAKVKSRESFKKVAASYQEVSRATAGMLRLLPLVLLIVFIMLPSVSRTIFSAWDCSRYTTGPGTSISYLRRDLSIECSTYEHRRVIFVAIFLVILWPVGMQLLFFSCLWINRDALRSGESTVYSRALRFLTGGYKDEFFYWETIELFRRLTCSGFVVLVPHDYIFYRIALAIWVSVPILVATAFLKPMKNQEDTTLALVSQSILVMAYCCCGLIRIVNTEKLSDEQKRFLVGFTNPDGVFLLVAIFCIIFLILLMSAYAYNINFEFLRQIRRLDNKSAREASTWLLVGGLIGGLSGLILGVTMFGMVSGLVGASILLPMGGALGSAMCQLCKSMQAAATSADPPPPQRQSCSFAFDTLPCERRGNERRGSAPISPSGRCGGFRPQRRGSAPGSPSRRKRSGSNPTDHSDPEQQPYEQRLRSAMRRGSAPTQLARVGSAEGSEINLIT